MSTLSAPMRIFAAFIGIASIAATLIITFSGETIMERTDGLPLENLWELARFFTIITNAIVAFCLIEGAVRGRWRSFSFLTGSAVWVALVGIIYHAVLSADHNPEGLAALTNEIHHTLVPIGTVLIWALTKERTRLSFSEPFRWLIFPLGYTVYILARGQLDGQYPYPFSNPDPAFGGWSQFFLNQLVLLIVFLAFGFVFWWLNNRLFLQADQALN